MKKINIFWFRRDLRLNDNVGLLQALKSEGPVLPIFIFDTNILDHVEDKDDPRLSFIVDRVGELKSQLNELGSDLYTAYGDVYEQWDKIKKKYEIGSVYFNHDYEPKSIKRDLKVTKSLRAISIEVHSFKDQCIFEKYEVVKSDGNPYSVYTPYKNKWRETLDIQHLAEANTKPHLKNFVQTKPINRLPTLKSMGFEKSSITIPSTKVLKSIIENYDKQRDIPSLDATSKLGLHFRFGTISVRQRVRENFDINSTWIDEIIWRDFFMQILFHYPHVITKPFRAKYEKIPWLNQRNLFKKWCEGRTGYPLVDAGMRELNQTGHMHNRVRMVTASFLVKHLLIDWRWGERYFAKKLLDYDLSANNGNWQWAAGTGCDASPYFRVFNPEAQQKRFDSKFEYIKKWVPEYGTDQYPEAIVEHKFARLRAIQTYKEAIS